MENNRGKSRNIAREIMTGSGLLFRSWKFYLGAATLVAGVLLNFASQTYLHNYMEEGKTLPMLSDLILDNVPYVDVSLYYDIFSLTGIIMIALYVFWKNDYKGLPFYLMLCGLFYITRGIFIVLTPFGNPPLFNGSNGPFNGFSKYELGVYPSGHVGGVFLFLLMVKDMAFKWILGLCLAIIIITLILARGHYSIDIFSGLFFAYAIKSFGDKYLSSFVLSAREEKEIVKPPAG